MVFTPAIYTWGDKFFSGTTLGYVYKVGEVQYLPEGATRNLNNTFGGGGLYTGGLNYIKGYRRPNNEVLTCLINPGDILSFQSEGSAIRVDALFPNNVWGSDVQLKGKYHSSDYDEMSTERLEALLADALEKGINILEEQSKNDEEDLEAELNS